MILHSMILDPLLSYWWIIDACAVRGMPPGYRQRIGCRFLVRPLDFSQFRRVLYSQYEIRSRAGINRQVTERKQGLTLAQPPSRCSPKGNSSIARLGNPNSMSTSAPTPRTPRTPRISGRAGIEGIILSSLSLIFLFAPIAYPRYAVFRPTH